MNSPGIKASLEADGPEVTALHAPAEFRDGFLKRIAYWNEFTNGSGVKLNRQKIG